MPKLTLKELEKEFKDEIRPILENPLYEVQFHGIPKKCTEEDIKIIVAKFRTSIEQVVKQMIGERIELPKSEHHPMWNEIANYNLAISEQEERAKKILS